MTETTPLKKKTKAEILAEYEKLQAQMEGARDTAKMVFEPTNLELVQKAKDSNLDSLRSAAAKMRNDVADGLTGFTDQVAVFQKDFLLKTEAELKRFEDLETAIEIATKKLEHVYHVEVTAQALQTMVQEFADKKAELESSLANQKNILESAIANQKLQWEREREEYEYEKARRLKHDADTIQEEQSRRERLWQEREVALKNQEAETLRIKKQGEELPQTIEKEVTEREAALRSRLEELFKNKSDAAQLEWMNKEQVYQLRLDNLQEMIGKLENELVMAKKDQEASNKRVQDLAARIIEAGAQPKVVETEKTGS